MEVIEEQILRGHLFWTVITCEGDMATVMMEFVLCPRPSRWEGSELIFASTEGADVWLNIREYMCSKER